MPVPNIPPIEPAHVENGEEKTDKDLRTELVVALVFVVIIVCKFYQKKALANLTRSILEPEVASTKQ